MTPTHRKSSVTICIVNLNLSGPINVYLDLDMWTRTSLGQLVFIMLIYLTVPFLIKVPNLQKGSKRPERLDQQSGVESGWFGWINTVYFTDTDSRFYIRSYQLMLQHIFDDFIEVVSVSTTHKKTRRRGDHWRDENRDPPNRTYLTLLVPKTRDRRTPWDYLWWCGITIRKLFLGLV